MLSGPWQGTTSDSVPGGGNRVAQGISDLSFICDNLTPGITYYFRVEADNSALQPALAEDIPDATPPPPDAPAALNAMALGLAATVLAATSLAARHSNTYDSPGVTSTS